MSSVSTPASRSTLSRRQFSETAASTHGTAKFPAATELDAASKGRALNPLAKEFVPAEEGPSLQSPTENSLPSHEEHIPAKGIPSNQGAVGKNGGVKANPLESGNHHKQSPVEERSSETLGGLAAAFKVPQARKSSIKLGHDSHHGNQPSSATSTSTSSSSGRRGQTWNANHLLNFQYDPIVRPPLRVPARRQHHKVQAYDKELFLQANFRFLVSDFGDYLENSTDPDKMLDWDDIAVVELSSSVPIQCPICLDSPPLCPQITSCGHIFCFPCILRYYSDENTKIRWKKCPLCFSMVSCKDLRTVYIHSVKGHKPGERIGFTLLTRHKGSVIPLKRNESSGSPTYTKDGRCHLYSKFTLTSDVGTTTDNAISELTAWAERAQSGNEEDVEQLPFVFAAIDELKLRKVSWDEHRTLEFVSSSPPVRQRIMALIKAGITRLPGEDAQVVSGSPEKDQSRTEISPNKGSVYHVNPFTDKRELVNVDVDGEPLKALRQEKVPEEWESLSTVRVRNTTDKEKDAGLHKHDEVDSYSFYQADDGQLIILHPLTMKCLVHHYGSYLSLPPSIEGKILEMETVLQTEASRKRYRFLSHLPLTSSFQLCEMDLSGLLPSSSLSPFKDELHSRELRRQRRQKQEKIEKVAEQRIEEKVIPPSPADFIAIMNVLHNDQVPTDSDFGAGISPSAPATSPPVDGRKLFSRVTKLGFAAGHDAPELSIDGSSSSSNRQSIQDSSPWKQTPAGSSGLSFADVIQREKEKSQASSSSRGSSKKGKKASQVLLSTGSGRKY